MRQLVQIDVESIREAVAGVFKADGADPANALLLANLLVDSDLAGHPSHGVYLVAQYHQASRAGIIDPRGVPRVISDTPGPVVVVDAGRSYGQVAAQFAAAVACDRAQALGLCAVVIRNCSHVGRLANHVDLIADRGMIGIMTANYAGADLIVAPPAGREGRLSTNPFAFSVPRAQRPHLILDMATSTLAFGALVINRRREATSEPNPQIDNTILSAFADHKGFGLSILVEVLSGILSGAGWSNGQLVEESQGVFITAIDPEGFCGRSTLIESVEEMVTWIKSSPPSGDEPVLVPGEAGELARQSSNGRVEIDPTTWDELRAVFADAQVEVPPTALTSPAQ